jgi:hypothetical protein
LILIKKTNKTQPVEEEVNIMKNVSETHIDDLYKKILNNFKNDNFQIIKINNIENINITDYKYETIKYIIYLYEKDNDKSPKYFNYILKPNEEIIFDFKKNENIFELYRYLKYSL